VPIVSAFSATGSTATTTANCPHNAKIATAAIANNSKLEEPDEQPQPERDRDGLL